ncbi:SDR family oxidoreductase [Sphingomonas sp.]|uniref:SDR family oxidoreductase n=1 Tax=Sphingomonas sp. TaxID=28214 RepID=UPI0031E40E83
MTLFDQFSLAGRSALVTGGASGLGLAYVEAVAEGGAAVTIADIDGGAAAAEAERLRNAGFDVRHCQVDVADDDAVRRAFDDHEAAFGAIDVVFANAGMAAGEGYLGFDGRRTVSGQIDVYAVDDWRKTLAIDLDGVFFTFRHAVRLMKKHGRKGSLIATTSNASEITCPIVPTPYMPAKAGVRHFVRQLARELAGYGIRVNAIAPGSVVTNIGGGVLHDPAVRAVWDQGVPLGRMGEPRQFKALALYLASDASDFMTGAELLVDGGVSLRGIDG